MGILNGTHSQGQLVEDHKFLCLVQDNSLTQHEPQAY